MTSQSNGCNGSMFSEFDPHHQFKSEDCAAASLNNLKRDRFELLSAYLDGEVTPQERRQVESWLRADESMQCLYARLLQLRQRMRSMPVPAAASSADDIAKGVCKQLDRRSRRPYIWGGTAAVAALFCAFFSSTVSIPQHADNPSAIDVAGSSTGDTLALSLNESLVQSNMVGVDDMTQRGENIASGEQLALSLNEPLFDFSQIEEN